MKEIKEFIQELCDCAKPSANGSVVALEDATRIVAHAFAAGMNFQDHEIKCKHKFRHFEKEDIDKVADFKIHSKIQLMVAMTITSSLIWCLRNIHMENQVKNHSVMLMP